MFMNRTLSIAIVCCQALLAAAQDAPKPRRGEEPGRASLRENVARLFSSFRELSDWDTHYTYMIDAVEKVYARNGWQSEPDAFSLSVIREVNAIPPWTPLARFDKLVEIVSDRYLLDERQEGTLRTALIRESNEMFTRHSDRIMQYAVEAIQTRAAGEPSDQRELLQADLDALNRRMDNVHEMTQRWARGEWQPSDWGLEDDPIQTGAAAQTATSGAKPTGGKARPSTPTAKSHGASGAGPAAGLREPRAGGKKPTATPQDQDPWAEYVRRFIRKYKLDDSQQARAWKIYRDVKHRGDKLRKRYGERVEAARRRAASAGDEKSKVALREAESRKKAVLDRLFEQLKRRLERLPTRAQRRNADPIDLNQPAEMKAKKPVKPMENVGP
jgi:hypothetical protein